MRIRFSDAAIALLVLTCVSGLAAQTAQASGPAQESAFDRRTKDMEVLEGLLEEFVQSAISMKVQESQRVAFESAVHAAELPEGATIDASWVLRMGGTSKAHGLFLDGYGLMFSVQTPSVSVLPGTIALTLGSGPRKILDAPGRLTVLPAGVPYDDAAARRVAVGALSWRARQLEQQIVEMKEFMESEVEVDETEIAELEMLNQELKSLRTRLAKNRLREPVAEAAAPEAVGAAPETELAVVDAAALSPTNRAERAFLLTRDAWARTVNDYGQWTDRAETERREISAVVVDAVIDTLARYGTLVHGLGPADRISVVVLPANDVTFLRLNRPERREEFVVSVHVRDVTELDNGVIDLEEFRQRAGIHSRLGIAMPLPARASGGEGQDEGQQ